MCKDSHCISAKIDIPSIFTVSQAEITPYNKTKHPSTKTKRRQFFLNLDTYV